MFWGRAAWESRSSVFYKNNYYFIAIGGVLRSRLYKINQNALFFSFFSKIILPCQKKAVPLHRQRKNKKFN